MASAKASPDSSANSGTKAVANRRRSREREAGILAMIRAIPEGFVTTYGDLCPEAPRLPGRVLATTAEKVPWHRVVRADGSLSQGRRQRKLLDAEGVPFAGKCVLMDDAHLPREALLNDA
jgi:methylated-DNA-protein-cysteine methyltransferase-like protein